MRIETKLKAGNITKTACTLLPYSILDLIKVDTTYLRTVILTASCLYSTVKISFYSSSTANNKFTRKMKWNNLIEKRIVEFLWLAE